jgi:polyphosphate kinase 2
MGKHKKSASAPPLPEPLGGKEYKRTLRALQIELVKLQHHVIADDEKILVLFEGRDAAGKDGTIKRIVEHLSPRETRVVALGKPSSRETTEWYFQRYAPFLPAADEFVLFNRSWYNRAGVERVMGFCTETQCEEFFDTVLEFERMLMRSGIKLFKYYLDITKDEQKERLEDRRKDPLKQWKISPIDAQAIKYWGDYSHARNDMFRRTHSRQSPWTVVRADNKPHARINVIRDLLARLDYEGKDKKLAKPDRRIVFPYDEARIRDGSIAP